MSIISQLPTSEVCEIVRRLRPRLYINFFQYLPPEVCLKVLGFLDPVSLMNTALASREWMQLAMDRKLWEQLYILEGFRVYYSEIRKFEEGLNVDRSRSGEFNDGEQPSKRRATPQRILQSAQSGDDSEMLDADSPVVKQDSLFGPAKTSLVDVDESMPDIPSNPAWLKGKSTQTPNHDAVPLQDKYNTRRLSAASVLSKNPIPIPPVSSLVVVDRSDNKKKLNWQYLYSQRRRLEANWSAEKYTNFQLPDPNYAYEAHKECIYTIQYAGKYLVSGSRDKSLRIWDLDTRRLVGAPLVAHSGSVLCLQFDASPEEDIIISGSSDSSVIIWRFSTGKVLQRLRRAHKESVLNVKFDKHVLVTCSKDKTIKIFNRRPISPGEMGYPIPAEVVQTAPKFSLNNYGYQPAPTVGLQAKPAWTMLACLDGHSAAVNAVQVLGNEVVSASGDRTLKVWNWPQQTCTRTLMGHTKGIACVQYDGRRIVSGSSDNEVKVFDKETGLEVASLKCHSALVRTVQAGFGDLPYSEEADKEDAKTTDDEYFKAVDAGVINRTGFLQRGRPRNAGSRRPEDITAYGAKIPPGGGGGIFGRIVSGSYDETIIIWKRDKEGVWKPLHTLRQEEALNACTRANRIRSGRPPAIFAPQTVVTNPHVTPGTTAGAPTPQPSLYSQAWYTHNIDTAVQHGPLGLRQLLHRFPLLLTHPHLPHILSAINDTPDEPRLALTNVIRTIIHAQQQDSGTSQMANGSQSSQHSATGQASSSSSTATQVPQGPAHQQQILNGPLVQTPLQTPATFLTAAQAQAHAVNAAPAPAPAAVPPPAVQAHQHAPAHPQGGNMMRVYKLQFDARRIICCSQTPVIVGWDFANGDEQLIEASRFFAPIE